MRTFPVLSALLTVGFAINPAHADIGLYGKLHLSAEYIDLEKYQGDELGLADTTLASNASFLGLKGEHELNYGFKATWAMESDIDMSGERDWLNARNRYIGLQHAYGKVIAGFHDTPLKELGAKVEFWPESIGDRRNIVGFGNGTDTDIRARNAAMYVSPEFYNTVISVMGSVGNDDSPTEDSQYLASASIYYTHEFFFVGLGGERQMRTDIRHDSIRMIGGFTAAGARIHALYDIMRSDEYDELNRYTLGGGASYTILDTSFRVQGYYATANDSSESSDAVSISVGVTQTFSRDLEMYLVYATTINGADAMYTLGAGEHGDHYGGDEAGVDMFGVSAGISYRFE